MRATRTANKPDKINLPIAIKIYPIPAKDKLCLEWMNGHSEIIDVEIISLTGRTIYRKIVHSGQIDISGFHPGIYLVKARVDNTVVIRRIIIH